MKHYYDQNPEEDSGLPVLMPFYHVTKWQHLNSIMQHDSNNLKFESPNHNFEIFFHYGMPNYEPNLNDRKHASKSIDPFPVAIELISNDLQIEKIKYIFSPTDSGYLHKIHPTASLTINLERLFIETEKLSDLREYYRKHVLNLFKNNKNYCQSKLNTPLYKIKNEFIEINELLEYFTSEAAADNRICTCELILKSNSNGPKLLNIQGLVEKIYLPDEILSSPLNRSAIKKLLKFNDANNIIIYKIGKKNNAGILDCHKHIKKIVALKYEQ